jgi:predicted  nucleic acid-binding Zn-ribbon protein
VEKERIAPVQGYKPGIPWSMHLRAYAAYCNQHGEQKALLDLDGKNCRGGFHVEELDEFIPSWREELTEAYHLRKRVEALEQERDGLSFNLDAAVDALANCQAKRDELQERAERAEAALTQLQEEVRLASNRASNRLMTPEKLAELLREPSHGQ